MSEPLGAVVVGTGFGVLTHLRALRAAGLDITALVGRDPDKTAARAAMFDVPHACTSLGDALALAHTDVVAVSTPPHTHGPLVLEAVGAGRRCCARSPSPAIAEARQMRARRRRPASSTCSAPSGASVPARPCWPPWPRA